MKFEFTKKTKELFNLGGWAMSWETGKNNADCLHHILGRVSNSPYNAAPLNNMYDHQPEGRKNLPSIHSFEERSKYLRKTKEYLDELGYTPTKEDLKFIKTYERYYKGIREQDSVRRGNNPFELISRINNGKKIL